MSIMNKIIKWLRGPEECKDQAESISEMLERHEAELHDLSKRYKDIADRANRQTRMMCDFLEDEDRGINLVWIDRNGIKHSEKWTYELFEKIMTEEGTTLVFE